MDGAKTDYLKISTRRQSTFRKRQATAISSPLETYDGFGYEVKNICWKEIISYRY